MKEKYTYNGINSSVIIEENKIISFDKVNDITYSFRVGKDGYLGVHYQEGKMTDEEGYARAEENLELKRPYPCKLEKRERKRDKTERVLTEKELLNMKEDVLNHIHTKYHDISKNGNFR